MKEKEKSDKKQASLNPKQERFCQLYASDKEFFGNGLHSYMEAYNIPPIKWKSALSASSRLLINGNILTRINELLELRGLNDPFVDKQLEFLVTQNADFKTKLGAIREYNQLRQRIKNKLEIRSPEIKEIGEDIKRILLTHPK